MHASAWAIWPVRANESVYRVTADSIKQITRDLERGFSGLSFQVIRRIAFAYAMYREAADAFRTAGTETDTTRRKRRRRQASRTGPYDPLQRLDKRQLAARIRALQTEVGHEHRLRAALADDQQATLAKILQLQTEIILLGGDRE
jgi:hypothetical protein